MKFAEGFDGNVVMLAPWYVINVGAVCTVLVCLLLCDVRAMLDRWMLLAMMLYLYVAVPVWYGWYSCMFAAVFAFRSS